MRFSLLNHVLYLSITPGSEQASCLRITFSSVGGTPTWTNQLETKNKAQVPSTKAGIPWKVIATFDVLNRSMAVLLEKKIKARGAKRYLNDIGM